MTWDQLVGAIGRMPPEKRAQEARVDVVVQVAGGVLTGAHATTGPGLVVGLEVVDWDNIEAGDPGPDGSADYDEDAHTGYVTGMVAIY